MSAKQRKEQLQLKRAVKRGDVPPPPPSKPDRHRKGRRGPTDHPVGTAAARTAAADASRRLESSFVRLPPAFLDRTRALAASLPLTRPIPPERAILPDVDKPAQGPPDAHLTCPRRPKWRYDMSKKEVEANEEGLFRKWLAQTDAALDAWTKSSPAASPASRSPSGDADAREAEASGVSGARESVDTERMPHAPTSFERNLEVWRQL